MQACRQDHGLLQRLVVVWLPVDRVLVQVAQKLHAVTGEGDRVRDLIDLQVVFANSDVDLAGTRRTCERLFAYRKAQDWPPTVVAREGWEEQYRSLAGGLQVLQSIGEAVEWANGLIGRIASA